MDGKVLCQADGAQFATNSVNVAVDRDFYALGVWTPGDSQYARLLIEGIQSEASRASALRFLRQMELPPKFEGLSAEIDEDISIFRSNAIEDQHAAIERAFEPLLERMLRGDVSFYPDGAECIPFVHYLSVQNLRTKGVKERLNELNTKAGLPDISRIWSFLALVFAQTTSAGLYVERRRRKLVLIRNTTNWPFVTGDQPVANLLAVNEGAPDKLAVYYPIAPRLALVLNEVDDDLPLRTETLTESQVRGLNAKIARGCHAQMFGDSRDALRFANGDDPWLP
ncbi:DUF4238 domain-containing protein [Paraburkholderia kururiensis]|uniref:DUF4238 domain-containing protein n=1 Tax=Paraburkholderia kururiensis TaxID=984307 RepID=UPI0018F7776E|nr:DUF4238 domain-containing protein [Paraburkholderia kururiensis]